jgi:hypothetical protein
VKHYGFSEVKEMNQDTSYDPWRNSANMKSQRGYESPPQTESRSRRASWRMSGGAAGSSSQRNSLSPNPEARLEMERRPSYNHKRDTQFEEYIARRSRGNSLQEGVDNALKREFGWASDPRDSVNFGTVSSSQIQQPRESATRIASWDINMGDSADPAGAIQRGHSLNSVPEAHEPQDADAAARKARPVSNDREGLLGSRGSSTHSYAPQDNRLEPVEGDDMTPLRWNEKQ